MIDPQTQAELRARFNPDGSDLRKMQLRMLEMLKFSDKICKENNIEYWIDSGTLLGAARHGGFIPWDDDVDICMTTKNLRKFEKIMRKCHSDEFVIQNHKTDKGYFGFWSVLRDLKSEYIQDDGLHERRGYKGLQIDIFPVETKINYFLFKVSKTLQYRLIDRRLRSNKKANVTMGFIFLKYILYPFFKLLSLGINHEYYTMSYGCSFATKRYLKNIYPLKHLQFEGTKLYAPCNVNSYLKDIYGNWEEIPSINNIHTHNVQIKFIQ